MPVQKPPRGFARTPEEILRDTMQRRGNDEERGMPDTSRVPPELGPDTGGARQAQFGMLLAREPEKAATILASMGVTPGQLMEMHKRHMERSDPYVMGAPAGMDVGTPVPPAPVLPSPTDSQVQPGLSNPGLPTDQLSGELLDAFGMSNPNAQGLGGGATPPAPTTLPAAPIMAPSGPQPGLSAPPIPQMAPMTDVQPGLSAPAYTGAPPTPQGQSQDLGAALSSILTGIKAPAAPEPQRIYSPQAPMSHPLQGGNLMAILQTLLQQAPQGRTAAPMTLGQALRG